MKTPPDKQATVFYDLEVGPESYNFAMFMVFAKRWLEDQGITQVRLIIVPGKLGGFRSMGNPHEIEYSHWRLNQLLVPLATAYWPEASLLLCRTRDEALEAHEAAGQKGAIYPVGYSLKNPIVPYSDIELLNQNNNRKEISKFGASAKSLRYIENWKALNADNKRLITITLREAGYQTPRNSDYPEWVKFVHWLDPKKYTAVVIPDTDNAYERQADSHGIRTMVEASFNLELRFALYQSSWLNMFVNSGPPMLCTETPGIPYLYFKLLAGDTECANLINCEDSHFLPGRLWPGADPYQKLIWEPDRFSMISKAFSILESRIEGTDTWPRERITRKYKEAIENSDAISERDWSACLVAFFEGDSDSWKWRAESLMRQGHHHEAYLTLMHACDELEGFRISLESWDSFKNEGEILANLQTSFISLLKTKRSWLQKSLFHDFLSKDKGKPMYKCLIYGTGQGGRIARMRLPERFQIIGYLDSNPIKQGQAVNNIPTYSPSTLDQLEYDLLLIASMARGEIYFHLLTMGIPVEKIHALEDDWIFPVEKLESKTLLKLQETLLQEGHQWDSSDEYDICNNS